MKQISERELSELIDLHQEKMLRHAFFLLGSFQDAEDIVQDTFVKFYQQSPALFEASKTKAYLISMVHNACIDLIRKKKQSQLVDLNQLTNLADEKLNGSKRKQQLHEDFLHINAVLKQIPEEQSTVIRMRTISNLSFVEIAKILAIPVTTVKSRFAYGIRKLREKTQIKKEVYDEL